MQAGKFAVVTVFNEDARVGTGFYVSTGDALRGFIVTPAGLVPEQKQPFVRYKNKGRGGPTTNAYRARVLYRDSETGLAFLAVGSQSIMAFGLGNTKKAKLGEQVFAIGVQVLGGEAMEHSAFEGTVSAVDRVIDGRPMLQLTLPANPGLAGSPVFNGFGQLIGVLWSSAGGMERTSFALPASAISEALGRYDKLRQAPPPPKPTTTASKKLQLYTPEEQEASFKTQPDPFAGCKTLKLTPEQSAGMGKHSLPYVLPGGGAVLVIKCDYGKSWLGVEVPTGKKLWSQQSKHTGSLYGFERGGHHAVFRLAGPAPKYTEIDLRTGRPSRTFAVQTEALRMSNYFRYRDHWIICTAKFRTFNTRTGAFGEFNCYPQATLGFLTVLDGHLYAIVNNACRRYPLDRLLPMMDRVGYEQGQALVAFRMKDPNKRTKHLNNARALCREIDEKLGQPVPGADFLEPPQGGHPLWIRAWCRPDSPWVVLNKHSAQSGSVEEVLLYRVFPKRIEPTGRFSSLIYSRAGEPWVQKYCHTSDFPEKIDQVRDISHDGSYAITAGFLWKLGPFRPILELPFPAKVAGFMPDGKHLYLYDVGRSRFVFPTLEELAKAGQPVQEK